MPETLKSHVNNTITCYPVLLLLLLLPFLTQAQLKADFNTDIAGGCAPLTVHFTNTTTGASANASYEWDLGNGNTALIKNPGAIYEQEKTYTVQLTVRDGNQVSTQSRQVTVYPKPVVDFSPGAAKVCLSSPATFTAQVQAGSGTISRYYWDFGDGTTLQGSQATQSHSYSAQQTASVSLTVVSSTGCHSTIQKDNIVEILPAISAGFGSGEQFICNPPGAVSFTNTSSGPGTLSYQWDFGDGTTSTDLNPIHTYTQKGIYSVGLTTSSSDGCVASSKKNNYINVASYNTGFSAPASSCQNASLTFTNTSTATPTSRTWKVDGSIITASTNLTYYFYTAGDHEVTLIQQYGSCTETVTKTVTIYPLPKVNGFVADVQGNCGAPVAVQFKDTTPNVVKWAWDFDYNYSTPKVNSTAKEPLYQYTANGTHFVLLTVTSPDGCTQTTARNIVLANPVVNIQYDYSSSPTGTTSCGPVTVRFLAAGSDPVVQYQWDFGDGGTSTDAHPQHIFNQPGSHKVKLDYVTSNGCVGTVTYGTPIVVSAKPHADFEAVNGTTICGNEPVLLRNLSTGKITYHNWYIDNVFSAVSSSGMTYQFSSAGKHSVKLIVYNDGCADTAIKTDYIEVLPPFPRIYKISNTCDGDRGTVQLEQRSVNATSVVWDLQDGNTISVPGSEQQASYHYAQTGTYKIVLKATNGQCTTRDSANVYVLKKQQPVLSFDKTEACTNERIEYTIDDLAYNPAFGLSSVIYQYQTYRWQNAAGQNFSGTAVQYSGYTNELEGYIQNAPVTQKELRVMVRSEYFGCIDTSNFVAIELKGVKAGFEIIQDKDCYQSPVLLKDTSQSYGNSTITGVRWNFGDGQASTQPGTVSHTYTTPGQYYVSLNVTDSEGCIGNFTNTTQPVQVYGTLAAFIPSGTTVPLNGTVSFYNQTNAYGNSSVTYDWDFGDGNTASGYNQSHTYTVAGTYTVTLTATAPTPGCTTTATRTITVNDLTPLFTMSRTAITANQCPPVMVRFTNHSTNYTRLSWDFGDGIQVDNQTSPSHVYHQPGKYIVTLSIYNSTGLQQQYKDSVIIALPQATLNSDLQDGCIGDSPKLWAAGTKMQQYTWDWGDGILVSNPDSTLQHQYTTAGIYQPRVLLTDANGCPGTVSGAVITIHPPPVITVNPATPLICRGTGIRLEASGGNQYSWSPATGLDNTSSNSVLANPGTTTTYTVQVTDAIGCENSQETTVQVVQPITLSKLTDTAICLGAAVELQAAGASLYQWIENTDGLSNTQIGNPVARPQHTSTYTLTGFDTYRCFSDTATVDIIVHPLPTVEAGPDEQLYPGASLTLAPATSPDVISWQWTPNLYLSCNNCAAPVSTPLGDVSYTITVANEHGCMASDALHVKMLCDETRVAIPNIFTPNGDGKNDVFMIKGISVVKHLVIYNRWGQKVFERHNFLAGDRSANWNGSLHGERAPTGSYVYFAELQCPEGGTFTRKGNIVLVR